MNRHEFLLNLRTELSFLPFDERESALKYYEEYFEEAGEENEASVISELGSPIQVASQIRRSLDKFGEDNASAADGETSAKKIELKLIESIEAAEAFYNDDDSGKKTINKPDNIDAADAGDSVREDAKTEENAHKKIPEEPVANSNTNNNYRHRPKRNASSVILTAVLLLFAAPILIPVISTVFVVVISLFITFFSIGIGFFCTSVAGMASAVAGVALVAYGIGMIFVNIMMAAGVIGQGLLAIGAGILLAYIFFVLAKFTFKWSWKITCKIFGLIGGAVRNLFAPRYNYNAA